MTYRYLGLGNVKLRQCVGKIAVVNPLCPTLPRTTREGAVAKQTSVSVPPSDPRVLNRRFKLLRHGKELTLLTTSRLNVLWKCSSRRAAVTMSGAQSQLLLPFLHSKVTGMVGNVRPTWGVSLK